MAKRMAYVPGLPSRSGVARCFIALTMFVSVCEGAALSQSVPVVPPATTPLPALGTIVPAGVHVRFHLDAPLSSTMSTTGQHFTFTLLDPIAVGAARIVEAGARGNGTVILAGHAGTGGHEGDLTLRVDYVQTPDRNELAFNDARFEVNGTNRKIASAVLGFVPYVGLGAHFLRGQESRIDTDTPVLVVSTRPATVMSEADAVFLTPFIPATPAPAGKTAATPSASSEPSAILNR